MVAFVPVVVLVNKAELEAAIVPAKLISAP
jgi:hypothetical protein